MTMTTTLEKPGTRMPDGSIYAGVSPDTGKPMYATPKDAPLTLTFDEAANYAVRLDAHAQKDWRVPTKAELNVLFQNRAAIGDFNETSRLGYYWSSSRYYPGDDLVSAWSQRFGDGDEYNLLRGAHTALRCVRG